MMDWKVLTNVMGSWFRSPAKTLKDKISMKPALFVYSSMAKYVEVMMMF